MENEHAGHDHGMGGANVCESCGHEHKADGTCDCGCSGRPAEA